MSDIKQFEPLWGVWRTEALIGEGSFGKVYRAVREEFGKKYYAAIKHISIPINDSQISEAISEGLVTDQNSARDYFSSVAQNVADEIAILSSVKGHTNIVSYEDHLIIPKSGGVGHDIFIRMELLTSLNSVINTREFTRDQVLKLGMDICSALDVCHGKGIIHRDVKPSNIFINDLGDYKIGDFGVARQLENTTSGMSKKGTYAYMAPELYRGEPASFNADIYSLGMVMYRLLNRKRAPFLPLGDTKLSPVDTERALMQRMAGTQLPAPVDADDGMTYIILKACEFDRTRRYQSAAEMKADLSALQKGAPMPSPGVMYVNTVNPPVMNAAPAYVPFAAPAQEMTSTVAGGLIGTVPGGDPLTRTAPAVQPQPVRTAPPRYTPPSVTLTDEQRAKRKHNIAVGAAIAGIFSVLLLGIVFGAIIPSARRSELYESAVEQFNSGKYLSAKIDFDSLGDYEDSEEYVKKCDYNIAKRDIGSGEYDEAISILEGLSGYSDSETLIQDAKYRKACDLLDSDNYTDAREIFYEIYDYSDSSDMVSECDYQEAMDDYRGGYYDSARELFQQLSYSDYKDSASYVALCDFYDLKEDNWYQAFDELEDVFSELKKYSSVNSECKTCCADGLFTIWKLFGSKFSNGYYSVMFYEEKNDSGTWLRTWNLWNNRYNGYWGFEGEQGKYGTITQSKSMDDDAEYVEWFQITGFDDPYSERPSSVTIRNPNNGNEYTLWRKS